MIDRDNLKKRVDQFYLLELPGQPHMMHMGTNYLVSDLWNYAQMLEDELAETHRKLRNLKRETPKTGNN